MSLIIYDRFDDELPKDAVIVTNIESEFRKYPIENIIKELSYDRFLLIKDIVAEIDKTYFNQHRNPINRLGEKISLMDVSTGCKGVLLLLLTDCTILDTIELGYNAIAQIVLNLTNKGIISEPLNYWPPLVYTDHEQANEIYEGTPIDVGYKGMHFTTIEKLNNYIEFGG